MTRAEFHKGLSGWLWAKRSIHASGSFQDSEAHAKQEAIDELITELNKSVAFENRFPWENPSV